MLHSASKFEESKNLFFNAGTEKKYWLAFKTACKNRKFLRVPQSFPISQPDPAKNVDFSCKRSDFAIKNEKNFLLLIDYRDIL